MNFFRSRRDMVSTTIQDISGDRIRPLQGRIGRHDFPVALPPAIEFVAFGDSPPATQANPSNELLGHSRLSLRGSLETTTSFKDHTREQQ